MAIYYPDTNGTFYSEKQLKLLYQNEGLRQKSKEKELKKKLVFKDAAFGLKQKQKRLFEMWTWQTIRDYQKKNDEFKESSGKLVTKICFTVPRAFFKSILSKKIYLCYLPLVHFCGYIWLKKKKNFSEIKFLKLKYIIDADHYYRWLLFFTIIAREFLKISNFFLAWNNVFIVPIIFKGVYYWFMYQWLWTSVTAFLENLFVFLSKKLNFDFLLLFNSSFEVFKVFSLFFFLYWLYKVFTYVCAIRFKFLKWK